MTRREFISLATKQICMKVVSDLGIPYEYVIEDKQYATSYGIVIKCLSEQVAKTLRLNVFRIVQKYKQQYSTMKYFNVDVIIEQPRKVKPFNITCRPNCECMVEVKINNIAKAERIVACCKLEGLI